MHVDLSVIRKNIRGGELEPMPRITVLIPTVTLQHIDFYTTCVRAKGEEPRGQPVLRIGMNGGLSLFL